MLPGLPPLLPGPGAAVRVQSSAAPEVNTDSTVAAPPGPGPGAQRAARVLARVRLLGSSLVDSHQVT
jgi:hypothetical protein